jgi:CheY-like chemotaxis protein
MASARSGPANELGGLVVLVVDDEPVVRAYVARALTLAGVDVAVAADGREALRLVADDRVRPQVVITDIEMPMMSGVELAARLLAIRPSIRIVMMTGDPERAESARRHPGIVDAVLLKPMRIEDIVATVRAVANDDRPDDAAESGTRPQTGSPEQPRAGGSGSDAPDTGSSRSNTSPRRDDAR